MILLASLSRTNSTSWRRFCDLRKVLSNIAVVETETHYQPKRQQQQQKLLPLLLSLQLQQHCQCRFYHELSFVKTGNDLTSVLEYCRDDSQDDLQPPPFPEQLLATRSNSNINDSATFSWVRVAIEAAPWNPADLNTIQGRYPTPKVSSQVQKSPPLTTSRHFPNRTVAGAQGIGRVTHIVTNHDQYQFQQQDTLHSPSGLQIGDWVTLGIPSFGTFRSSVWVPARTNIVTIQNDSACKSPTITVTRSDALLIFRGTTTADEGRGRVDEYLRASRHHVAAASMLFQLGGTALRMLRDFVPQQQRNHDNHHDDADSQTSSSSSSSRTTLVVLQNAANSGVGYMVAQSLRHFHSNTNTLLVSLVRRGDRSDADLQAMVDYLTSSSNNDNDNHHDHVVLLEDDLHNNRDAMRIVQEDLMSRISKMVSSSSNDDNNPPPISFLALNAVGGPSADLLLQLLQRLSSSSSSSSSSAPPTMVTYGGMSQQPITVKTGPLVFDNLALRGYWHSRWLAENTSTATSVEPHYEDDPRQSLLDELVDAAIIQQRIQLPPVDLVSLSVSLSNDDIVAQLMNHGKKQSLQPIRHKLVLDLREETSS